MKPLPKIRALKKCFALQKRQLCLLHKIGQEISSSLNIHHVLTTALNGALKLLHSDIGSILLLDHASKTLTIKVAKGLPRSVIKNTRLKLGERISGHVAQTGEPLLIKNINREKHFKPCKRERYFTESLISAPVKIRSKIIGVININNKHSKEVFTHEDLMFLENIASEIGAAIENARTYKKVRRTYIGIVKSLVNAIDARDHYTKEHSENVARYAVKIAKQMDLSQELTNTIEQACQLHDIGKIAIPDAILNKPGNLTPQERKVIETHSTRGAQILKPLDFLKDVAELVEQNHERYDGKGYPHGLKKTQIRLGARILAIADAYDTMVSQRPYRRPMAQDEAIQELIRNKNKHFDAKVVNAFLKVLRAKS